MKKNTIYILGGVAVVGLAYYLYNKNKTTSQTNSSGFANLSGVTTSPLKVGGCNCELNTSLRWARLSILNPDGKTFRTERACISC